VNGQHNAKSKLSAETGFFAVLPSALGGFRGGTVAPRLRLQGLAASILLFTLFLVLSSAATAKQLRLFSGAFGAVTSTPSNPYPLSKGLFGPSSVAVDDSTGDVYVTDQGNRRIEKFTAGGGFILMFGKEVNRTKVAEAAPEGQQNVCTADSGDICQAGARASSPGAFDPANLGTFEEERAYLFLAVDNSSGPSKGDVYIADSGDGLITKFDSSGQLVESWGDNGPGGSANGQLNGSGATSPIQGFYARFEGIATDSSGNLWVADGGPNFKEQGAVAEFGQDSSFIRDWSTGESFNGFNLEDSRAGIALDSLDNIYALPNKYNADGNWFGRILQQGEGVAVDPSSNELYIVENLSGSEVILRFDASCKPVENRAFCMPVESFGAGHFSAESSEEASGLAIDPAGAADTIYAAQLRGEVAAFSIETVPDVLTAKASGFTASSATLNGTVNPAGVALSECFFEWGQTSGPYEHTAPCEPSAAAVGSGTSPVPIHAGVSGLQSGKTYHFRLVAANAHNVNGLIDEPSLGAEQTFGPPLLESSGAAAVSSTAATLQAEVDPNGVDTSLRFEYGTEAGVYDHVTATVDLGSGGAFQSVSQPIEGLEPPIAYHYRVILENIFGTVEGEDHSFTTQGSAFPGLPDDRVWELVSPPDKNGVPLEAISNEGGDIQAASDGSGLAYIAKGAIDSDPAGDRSFAETQLLARRRPASWSTQDIAAPHQAPAGIVPGKLSEYLLFSTDLSVGALQPFGATPLSPEASEYTPYLHQSDGAFTPLVYPGNVPPGTKFGGQEKQPEEFGFVVWFATGTPDLSHLILTSPSVLTTPSFAAGGHESLYEWAGGSLGLVSLIPAAPTGVCGGAGPACSPAAAKGFTSLVGNQGRQMRHAISTDGSRVIFTAGGHLFLRDMARRETVQLDALQERAGGGNGAAIFQDASIDGSRVFFTDESRLTVDSTTQEKPDLYMCNIGEQAGHLACTLTDISVDHHPGGTADIQGDTIGSDEAGRYVYFVANGVLAPGAISGDCTENPPTQESAGALCNLYAYDTETRKIALVAVLSGRDSGDWDGTSGANLAGLTAAVSSSGRFLAFMSERPLTGYDNRDARDGQPDQEVYLYDASANEGSGKLVCASCNPTGARPAGVLDAGGFPGMLVDRPGAWAGEQLAASIPGWTKTTLPTALYRSRYLSDGGRLFFNAADALVPQDSNGVEDVYQYEPPGVGGCTESNPTFGKASAGCVGLVSSGTSSEESAFLDASESGDDVFFLTASKLAPADVDGANDVYDAHVCGAESSCPSPPSPPPPACEGDACQSPVPAPDDPTPGSLTFEGPGNLTFAAPPVAQPKAKPPTRAQKLARALRACRKKPTRKRLACERHARRAYGPLRAKKSNGRGK
jgi:DNA-binding beta-propeller fold protein YncE